MSAASYPTMSMVIPVLDGLKHLLSSTSGGLDVLRDVLLRLLNDKFGDVKDDVELCVATVIDPRFKLLPFDTPYQRDCALAPTKVAMTGEICRTAESSPSSSRTPSKPAAGPVSSIWDKLQAAATAVPTEGAALTSDEAITVELNNYVAMPCITQQECPLRWWGEQRGHFPAIARVAQQLLAVPATSVASERLFSKAGDVISKNATRLHRERRIC